MMDRDRTYTRAARGRRDPFFVAVLLFVMLCGAALVTLGGSGSTRARGAVATEIRAAIKQIDRAGHALDATDYGQARRRLIEARSTLRALTADEQ